MNSFEFLLGFIWISPYKADKSDFFKSNFQDNPYEICARTESYTLSHLLLVTEYLFWPCQNKSHILSLAC